MLRFHAVTNLTQNFATSRDTQTLTPADVRCFNTPTGLEHVFISETSQTRVPRTYLMQRAGSDLLRTGMLWIRPLLCLQIITVQYWSNRVLHQVAGWFITHNFIIYICSSLSGERWEWKHSLEPDDSWWVEIWDVSPLAIRPYVLLQSDSVSSKRSTRVTHWRHRWLLWAPCARRREQKKLDKAVTFRSI